MGAYIPLAGFVARLQGGILPSTRHLPLSEAAYQTLLDTLGDGGYSFLEIRDGNAAEVVKVRNVCGKIVIDRGAEETSPLAFRCGIGVAFTLTAQGVKDAVCQMNGGDCREV